MIYDKNALINFDFEAIGQGIDNFIYVYFDSMQIVIESHRLNFVIFGESIGIYIYI